MKNRQMIQYQKNKSSSLIPPLSPNITLRGSAEQRHKNNEQTFKCSQANWSDLSLSSYVQEYIL